MKKTIIIAAFIVFATYSTFSQNIVGDWQGTLHAGPAELRLVLHIARNADGSYTATLDSIDQGANGIPVSSTLLKAAKLSLTVNAVNGTYEGTVNKDATEINGTWTQNQPLPLDFKRATSPIKMERKPAKPSDIDGDWLGTLDTGMSKLRLAVHIFNTEDGLMATMDSLDQGAKGIPVTTVTRNGAVLKLEVKGIGGVFEGTLDKDLTTVAGTWKQGGGTLPLVLKRTKNAAELERRRPQNPAKPYPYREEEVSFDNKAAGITLAATLTIPPGKGPFPAVFLITGSGRQDRDETLLGHRPFLVLSDYLTRHGIAVLRADDRGFGKSTGNFAKATTEDFAADAEAAVFYLKGRHEVDVYKIGLVGHSEGGIVAPMVAARNPDVAFIVMMAGIGVSGEEILVEQVRLISEAGGKSKDEAAKLAAQQRDIIELIKQEKDDAVLEKKLRVQLNGQVPDALLGARIQQVVSPWFRYFIAYDPTAVLQKVHCPVLAIDGEKDLQVPPKENLDAIRKALEAGGNKNVEVKEFPGLNHLFQTAKTGSPVEYAEIEETMSPVALEKVSSWILQVSSAR